MSRSPYGERGLKYLLIGILANGLLVALLTESVDRNRDVANWVYKNMSRSPYGERGLK